MNSTIRAEATDEESNDNPTPIAVWRFASFALIALLVIANFPLISGRSWLQWDQLDFFEPGFSLVADHARHGRLLLWNPWAAAGSPDFAETEFGATSPLVLCIALLCRNSQIGYVIYWLMLWAMGGVGVLFLARHLKAPVWAAFVVALGYTASGFNIGHGEHLSSLCSIAYLPWMLWRLDLALEQRSYWPAVQAGVLFGLSALGGYPMFTITMPGFLALWALGRVLCGERGNLIQRLIHAGVLLSIVTGLGMLICSPLYVGMLHNTWGYSDRIGPRSRDEAIHSNAFPFGATMTLASPFLALLNEGPRPLWPVANISMTTIWVGGGILALAALSLRERSKWNWWLWGMTAFFFCAALGSQTPLRGWLYDFVPTTRYFRNAALFREYVILLLAVVAALAARHLVSIRRWLWVAAAVLGALATAAFFYAIRLNDGPPGILQMAKMHLLIVWAGLLAVGLWARFANQRAEHWRWLLIALASVDFLGTIAISKPLLYVDFTTPLRRAMETWHDGNLDLTAHGLTRQFPPPAILGDYAPNNRNQTLKIPIFDSFITFSNRFQQQMAQDRKLANFAIGEERTWFSTEPAWLPPTDAAFGAFKESLQKDPSPPLLLHRMQEMNLRASMRAQVNEMPRPAERIQVANLHYHANSLTFDVQAPANGWVMITDRWAPDWHANVNGKATDVVPADFIFRAVPVQAGLNAISMNYLPRFFIPLLTTSWGILFLYVLWEVRRARR